MSFAEARARARKEKADWERIDAMTDEDIARQIAEDPDVAPDMSETLERGEFEVVWGIDLAHIRSKTGLDQTAFAARFGLPSEELVDWETAGRVPNRTIWMYLKLIEREPEIASRAAGLDQAGTPSESAGHLSRPKSRVPHRPR
jgi:putative transcriptional regulator